jgi:hypothetical protein
MKINNSQKFLLISVMLLFVVLIFNAIFIYLLVDKIYDIKDKENQLNLSLKEREKEILLKEAVDDSTLERAELENYFVKYSNLDTVKFTEYLEDLADTMNLEHRKTLDYETISEIPNLEFVSMIRFKFSISGRWQDVFNFIRLIEVLPKVSSINNLILNVIVDNDLVKDSKYKRPIWSADLDFSVLRLNK